MNNSIDRVLDYNDYDVRLQLANGCYVVGIRFDTRWHILQPKNDKVKCMRSSHEGDNSVFYAADMQTGTDAIFDAIDETIAYNLEVAKKMELMKVKVNELHDLFVKEPYERLATLEFRMKGKAGRKPKDKATAMTGDAEQADGPMDVANAVQDTNEAAVEEKDTVNEGESIDKKVQMAVQNT